MNTNEIINKLGIKPNDMQTAACKAITEGGHDVVILSPTGTGKTYAYLIPIASMLDALSDELQAVVILPGRELALQSANVLKGMGTGLRTMALYGGRPTMDEHRKLRQKERPQIVFATPGRLNDHLDKGNINADDVKFLVIDEFDKMLQMGFQNEMSQIISKLPSEEHRVLLSATDAEEIPSYLRDGFEPLRLDFLPKEQTEEKRVNIYKVESPDKDKLETLARLLVGLGNQSSIVFLNYRDSVERTAQYLKELGFTISMFHGGLDQVQRERSLYLFSNGTANILVCTDLASRGLDIPNIENIIHYHIPEGEDAYIHRVGRTARWDKHGRTFFILSPQGDYPRICQQPVGVQCQCDDNPLRHQRHRSTHRCHSPAKDGYSLHRQGKEGQNLQGRHRRLPLQERGTERHGDRTHRCLRALFLCCRATSEATAIAQTYA